MRLFHGRIHCGDCFFDLVGRAVVVEIDTKVNEEKFRSQVQGQDFIDMLN
jgi:hypothetical protein